MSFPNRVLVAKHGLHKRGCGARVSARAWRGADKQSPKMVVNAVRWECPKDRINHPFGRAGRLSLNLGK